MTNDHTPCDGYVSQDGTHVQCHYPVGPVMDRQVAPAKYRKLCRECWDRHMATTGRRYGKQVKATEPPVFTVNPFKGD